MKNLIEKKIIFAIFASTLLISCAKTNNNNLDFDFSSLKKPNKVNAINNEDILKNNSDNSLENKSFVKDLVPLETREKIKSKIKYGKKNPFSKSEFKLNKLNSSLELTGILNTEINKFALVSYLDKEGTISENSIGGLNTNLLPKGAKVINIDPQRMQLIITYKNKNFIFKMQNVNLTK